MEKNRHHGNGQKKGFLFLLAALLFLCFSGRLTVWAAEDNEPDFVPSEIEAPRFSQEAGFYEKTVALSLAAPDAYTIFYTLDGSIPQSGNGQTFRYDGPINLYLSNGKLLTAATVRAVAVTPQGLKSDVVTNTYFVSSGMSSRYQIPVISLVTEPTSLYDSETGLFENPTESGKEWERPAHFEFFLPNGQREISMNLGIRVHGAYSRSARIKSLRLYARAEYDTQKNIKYDFFSDQIVPAIEKNGKEKTITKFKRLILRTGGNEGDAWETTFFRDALAQSLMTDTKLDMQGYRPAVMYLNGEFYGIMNIREREDERYLSSHYNCSEEDVVIYGFEYERDWEGKVIIPETGDAFQTVIEEGSDDQLSFFEEAFRFVTENDLNDRENYKKAKQYFDIDHFIDYLCVQIYSGNTDWPHNNAKAWRYTGEASSEYGLDGRIRFLLYDVDFAFGLYEHRANESILSPMMKLNNQNPYVDVISRLFRGFLQNDGFRQKFARRFDTLLKTKFVPEQILKTIDSLAALYEPIVLEVYEKYGQRMKYSRSIDIVKDYVSQRTDEMKTALYQLMSADIEAPDIPEEDTEPTKVPEKPDVEPTAEPQQPEQEPTKPPKETEPTAEPTAEPEKEPTGPETVTEPTDPVTKDEEKTQTEQNTKRLYFFVIFGVVLLALIGIILIVRKK